MLIYLCLSSHGYGHASRQAAIFEEIHRIKPNWKLIVSSIVNRDFLDIAFSGIPIEHRRIKWDIGTIQSDALGVNYSATLENLKSHQKLLPEIIDAEFKWIKKQNSPVLIIGDIPPAAGELSSRLGCDLVWVGNFGWDDIYRPYGEKFNEYIDYSISQYSKGKVILKPSFSMKMDWGVKEIQIGIIASKTRMIDKEFLKKIGIKRTNVIFAFGGLGIDIDFNLFKKWPGHLFLIPEVFDFKNKNTPSNVLFFPKEIRVLDLLPYCSRIITKPGFSTFCEALTCKVGIHCVERENFEETDVLKRGLKKYGLNKFISKKEYLSGNWELDKELTLPLEPLINCDGARSCAEEIIKICYDN